MSEAYVPSVWRWEHEGGAIGVVERYLLGSLFADISGILECDGLAPADFADPGHGAVFQTTKEMLKPGQPRPNLQLVSVELERRGVRPPAGAPDWFTALLHIPDAVDEVMVREYVRAIKTAARDRRIDAWQRRPPDATT
jgi:replicative DNA helicase